jgi:magnesium chelatase family protein
MTLAVVRSRAVSGMLAPEVTVEVHLANGLPSFTLVGLPEAEVRESRERVRAALQNAGFDFPARRITVNMAPADLPKESTRYDLPIAIGILAASGQAPVGVLDRFEFAGELSLSGELRPVPGALAMILAVSRAARERTLRSVFLPVENADEAVLVGAVPILAARDLRQVVGHLEASTGNRLGQLLPEHIAQVRLSPPSYPDFEDVKGQEHVKRALEIAAAGGHSVLMVGPPGAGKSMLAQRFPGLLPPMDVDEAMESAAVLSLVGKFAPQRWATRVFRAPHHSASVAALVGGGPRAEPGEITLAHHGVLFLDELPEFERRVLDSLREPLETGRITVARAARHVEYPARFQLISAMNPCPCGHFGHPVLVCRCTPEMVSRYQDRISGPLLDRIDMRVEVPSLSPDELAALPGGEPSSTIAERVAHARQTALRRQGKLNDELGSSEVERVCKPEGTVRQLLHAASARMGWSARAYHRVLKVARSIADVEQVEKLGTQHVAEAIQYRRSMRET